MKMLETSFVSGDGGFAADVLNYQQVIRSDKAAVYCRSRNNLIKDYEVFKIRIFPKGHKIFQQILEDDEERYPSTGQFGISAWSYRNKTAAIQHFEFLNKEASKIVTVSVQTENLIIPDKAFSINEFAESNNIEYSNAFLFIKDAIKKNLIRFARQERRNARGKMTNIFEKVICA